MKMMQRDLNSRIGRSRPHTVALSAALALAVCIAAPLGAQVVQTGPTEDSERGWLGLEVASLYECTWGSTEQWKPCELVLHVERVQTRVAWNNLALLGFLERNGFAPAQQLVLRKAIESD